MKPCAYGDEPGYFMEMYNQKYSEEAGLKK